MIETSAGTQPGDPAKAATAILTVLDTTRADITTWEKLARDTRLAD
jgi:hypothetical protein